MTSSSPLVKTPALDAPAAPLSASERERYRRQMVLPELGIEGQRRLKGASVLCVGAGGLGSPLALYLAAAGVGRIGLADFDAVELSNLQRQILYSTADVGRGKLEAARARLEALNPDVSIAAHPALTSPETTLALVAGYDVVADGTDNFAARYLVSDACVRAGKPNVHASVLRFEGRISVFCAPQGPCYRCLHPEPPAVPTANCAEAGVLGAVAGVVGAVQAVEVLKLLLGAGNPLVGRLMLFDALALEWRELKVSKDPACPACGKKRKEIPMSQTPEMTVEELKAKLDTKETFILLDVREPEETAQARIAGSTMIPLGSLPERLGELEKSQRVVVHCRSGGRSARAVQLLRAKGFDAVNVAGGILAWAQRIDPSLKPG